MRYALGQTIWTLFPSLASFELSSLVCMRVRIAGDSQGRIARHLARLLAGSLLTPRKKTVGTSLRIVGHHHEMR